MASEEIYKPKSEIQSKHVRNGLIARFFYWLDHPNSNVKSYPGAESHQIVIGNPAENQKYLEQFLQERVKQSLIEENSDRPSGRLAGKFIASQNRLARFGVVAVTELPIDTES